MNASYLGQFQQTYLFREFSEHELHELFKSVKQTTRLEGEVVFESDALGASLYLIHYGSIRIEGLGSDGKSELTVYKAMGSIFGENAFLLKAPRFVHAIATEKTELFEIGFKELESFLANHTEASSKFYAAFARHLAESMHGLVQELIRARETHKVHATKYAFA